MNKQLYTQNALIPKYDPAAVATYLNVNDLTHVDHFARTYGFTWNPTDHLARIEKCKDEVAVWASYAASTAPTAATIGDNSPWKAVQVELEELQAIETALRKIDPIKALYEQKGILKWGGAYTFSELLQLDNLLTTTLRVNGITNPLQIDTIKKACKVSIEIDRAITERAIKEIKDLSTAYSGFLKAAQIDDVIAASNNDVIATVADLGEFIEANGGQFTYYDGVERDVVDKTINDYQAYVRRLVEDATGLDVTLEAIKTNYERALEDTIAGTATNAITIEELLSNDDVGANVELDEELAATANDPFEWEEDDSETPNPYFGGIK